MAALKRPDERRLIDHGPPSHVGEVRSLFDRGYRPSVEQAPRLGGAWKRNGDVVSLAQSGAQLCRGVQFVGEVHASSSSRTVRLTPTRRIPKGRARPATARPILPIPTTHSVLFLSVPTAP